MSQYSINFSDVEDFDVIPEGKYSAVVTEASLAENKAGDGHNIVWQWQVDVNGTPRKMRMWSSLKPTALWRVKKMFKAMGILQDEMNFEVDEDTGYILSPELVGIAAVVEITNSNDSGEMRSNISNVFGPDEATGSNGSAPKKSKAKLV